MQSIPTYDTLPFNYSDRGRLEGHIVLGVQMLQEKLQHLPSFPAEKASLLKHLILSHHGRYEFGAPTLPMTMEAFVLNLLDDLDAKANFIGRLGNRLEEDTYQWSDYQRTLERFLFVKKVEVDPDTDVPLDASPAEATRRGKASQNATGDKAAPKYVHINGVGSLESISNQIIGELQKL